jgi:hypothetical protein
MIRIMMLLVVEFVYLLKGFVDSLAVLEFYFTSLSIERLLRFAVLYKSIY